MINPTHRSRRSPSGSYFAPLRAEQGDIVLTSNHYITPEMRLTAMDERCNLLDLAYASDSQWCYDKLNVKVQAKREEGRIDYEAAKGLINFLEPPCAEERRCPFVCVKNCYHDSKYHNRECLKPTRWKKRPIPIEGAVSLFDLSNLTVESYYGDDWVGVQLRNYVKEWED